eukprot:jgi/Psemu1/296358/fgenesh1_pm.148_\
MTMNMPISIMQRRRGNPLALQQSLSRVGTGDRAHKRAPTALFEGVDDDNKKPEAWDENVDYDKEWPDKGGDSSNTLPDPGTSWDTLPNKLNPDFLGNDATELLGINLELEPLSAEDADRLRNDARKIVEAAIDAGVNDIEALKKKMKRELDANRRAMSLASDLEAKRQTDQLMSKIDRLTGDFLKSTESTRKSTKMAAAASRAMEGTSKAKGLEVGTWGILGGRTVVADDDIARSGGGGLLGSMGNAIRENERMKAKSAPDYSDLGGTSITYEEEAPVDVQESRILIIADMQKDKMAKALVPALMNAFEREEDSIPDLKIDVLAPTANMPLGGNDCQCVVVFCSGLSQPDSLKKMLDRLLRKTLATGGGKVGTPPTQLIGISTLGTERFNLFPYSMQNFLGGKLETRRQIEEVLINTVRNRVVQPPLDYTILKVKEGEFVADGSGTSESGFSLLPGDVLDDATSVETAAQVLLQAIAFQPPARNSTMSVSGSLPSSLLGELPSSLEDLEKQDDFWRETFACLDGPELWQSIVYDVETAGYSSAVASDEIADYYDRLVEYLKEWANLLARSGKGLTTPIRAETDSGLDPASMITTSTSRTLLYQDGVRLLFLPTNTGRNYVSFEEERENESRGKKRSSAKARKIAKEGGIDVVVEIANLPVIDGTSTESGRQQLRVRARRTNYAEGAVIKELSETTIVKRLEDALEVFVSENVA